MLALLTQAGFQDFIRATGADLGRFLPELALVAAVCVLVLADLFVSRKQSKQLGWLAFAGTLLALYAAIERLAALDAAGGQALHVFGGMLVVDRFATFFDIVFLVGTAVTIIMAALSRDLEERPMGEFYAIMLAAVLGMFLMVESVDLLMIFIAVELLSIPSYLLTGWIKSSRKSTEAALKYVVYGSVASGIMLYGFSLFFGMTGSMKLGAIARLVQDAGANPHAIAIAAFLAFAGFAYKMAAVPMQFWAPDVYQAAPTSVTAWLSVTSKAAGIGLFLRFMDALGLGQRILANVDWVSLVALVAAVTMTLGNLAALFQTNVKRLLAYSSVAHVGYILMGVAAFGSPDAVSYAGWKAVSFYVVAYLIMNLGAFTCVILMANQTGSEEIDSMRGMKSRAPFLALGFAIFLISLIGIPPTVGFAGKFQLFLVAVNFEQLGADGALYHPLLWLAIVAAVNTAISAYYYARILKVMYLEEGPAAEIRVPAAGSLLVVAQLAAVLYFGVFFQQLLGWAAGLHMARLAMMR
jgi:NADH-quinone oxidoreductase subunit N